MPVAEGGCDDEVVDFGSDKVEGIACLEDGFERGRGSVESGHYFGSWVGWDSGVEQCGAMSESREHCFDGIVFGWKVGFVILYKILALHESFKASASCPCMHLMQRDTRQTMTAKWRPRGDFSKVFRAALIAAVVPHHRGSSTCSTTCRVISSNCGRRFSRGL